MIRLAQRYISKELTHFVGRKEISPDSQYDLLKKIIEQETLSQISF